MENVIFRKGVVFANVPHAAQKNVAEYPSSRNIAKNLQHIVIYIVF
jgi:hypothetical protein